MSVQQEIRRASPGEITSASVIIDPLFRASGLVNELKPALLRYLASHGNYLFAGLYQAGPDDSLLLPYCALASEFLAERLRALGVPAQEFVCHSMPLECSPYYFRRGDDPFPQSHLLVLIGEGEDQIVLDPTYKQFLTHHVQPPRNMPRDDIPAYVKNALSSLPDILLYHKRDLPEFIEQVAELLVKCGAIESGSAFRRACDVRNFVKAVFQLERYQKAERKYSQG